MVIEIYRTRSLRTILIDNQSLNFNLRAILWSPHVATWRYTNPDPCGGKATIIVDSLGAPIISFNLFSLTTSGWWYTYPSEKLWKSVGIILPNIWKNKSHSKPPTRHLFKNDLTSSDAARSFLLAFVRFPVASGLLAPGVPRKLCPLDFLGMAIISAMSPYLG